MLLFYEFTLTNKVQLYAIAHILDKNINNGHLFLMFVFTSLPFVYFYTPLKTALSFLNLL